MLNNKEDHYTIDLYPILHLDHKNNLKQILGKQNSSSIASFVLSLYGNSDNHSNSQWMKNVLLQQDQDKLDEISKSLINQNSNVIVFLYEQLTSQANSFTKCVIVPSPIIHLRIQHKLR